MGNGFTGGERGGHLGERVTVTSRERQIGRNQADQT